MHAAHAAKGKGWRVSWGSQPRQRQQSSSSSCWGEGHQYHRMGSNKRHLRLHLQLMRGTLHGAGYALHDPLSLSSSATVSLALHVIICNLFAQVHPHHVAATAAVAVAVAAVCPVLSSDSCSSSGLSCRCNCTCSCTCANC